ncbi:MAG: DUF4157 domain-containing protein [Nitrospira sp.]|nr:DUF4157 domain-containing protein [Nitrospira sp.]
MLQRQCACGETSGLTGSCPECEKTKLLGQSLQTKLRISEPGDAYEQEADRVAEQVVGAAGSRSGSIVRASIHSLQQSLARTPVLQRNEAADTMPMTEGDKPKEEGSRCPSWRSDPESISKRAAEFYARNHMTPTSPGKVERIQCEPPISNGNYGCYVHLSDGIVLRVIVRESDIIVGTGPGPITTLHPPAATPLCFYEYACPAGDLVLTVKECKSAKPPAPAGPTLVGRRHAAPGAAGSVVAPPIVHEVLASSGRPLDVSTRGFFEARFGHDFGHVRIHSDAQASESARRVNALAYTVGRDIVFGAGQFDPHTQPGRKLLAHELTHVVQGGGAEAREPMVQKKADLSTTAKANVKQGELETEPVPPVDCAREITPAHNCFALIGDMIEIQADMRENNQWLERYRNGDIPWDADAYTARARHQGDLRDRYQAKERIRAACCDQHQVPGEAPTAAPSPTPAPVPSPPSEGSL